ncbi:MAG TPA: NADH-quinone oxidoreductase subunit NuoI [Nitrospiria bacterium]
MKKLRRFIHQVFFVEILIGLVSTFRHLFVKPITYQYPHEKKMLPDGYRGMIGLLRYDDGTEKCVGCDLCEAACPSRVITVISAEVENEPLKRYAKDYSMDMTRCVFCGFCVDACPVDALGMTAEFEFATYDKRKLNLDKEQLLAIGDKAFPDREKPVEFQHPHAAFFNVAKRGYPAK